MLTLILGGARSGKSKLAQQMAAAQAGAVTYIATAERHEEDDEMIARIDRHRAHRPGSWDTIEEPLDVAWAVERAAKESDTIVVDCLTIWVSNLFWRHRDGTQQQIEECARKQLERITAAAEGCPVILVSNETGCGTVPEAAVTRAFRDIQGFVNQWTAEAADEVIFTVAGLPLYLKTAAPR